MQRSETDRLVVSAIVSAGAMIAFQVGGRAARDALFLSNFPVTALPAMLAASAAVSIAAVLVTSHLISKKGPSAVIPIAFGASSILLLAEWMIYNTAPQVAAAVFYLHLGGFGAILVSGFWSIISELFDPRTAKRKVGRIAAGGTLGGLIGGLIAERTGAIVSVSAMLPVLAVLHLVCALLNRRLQPPPSAVGSGSKAKTSAASARSGFDVLRAVPYLKQLAFLVMLSTIAETVLDYVLKTQALGAFSQSRQLLRFFALFYTGTSLVTFVVQVSLSRYSLQKFGLTTTISTMPVMVAAGGAGALMWPGLFSTGLVRGIQSVLRSSLFRSGYELLYGPVSPEEKRAAKTIVDVGFDKLGDALGAGVIRLVLAVGLSALMNARMLIGVALVLGVVSLLLTFRLSRGYIATLEKSLLSQAADLELMDLDERTTRATLLRTLGTVDLRAIRRPNPAVTEPPRQSAAAGIESESLAKCIVDLQSEHASVVRAGLAIQEPLDALLIPPVIRLLARDDVSEDAVKALRNTVSTTVGQLTDALLNAGEDFAVRRRIPRVLAYCPSPRAVEGLMFGLADSRFEVRFSCGRGLSRICGTDPTLRPLAARIYAAALQEIATARRIVEMPRVLDRYEDRSDSAAADMLWKSADIRLEHIFRLLALCLSPEPLHVAFQALHTHDAYLRGTALEYLESVLPTGIREALLQFLEGPSRLTKNRRPAEHVAAELLRSRHEIAMKLVDM